MSLFFHVFKCVYNIWFKSDSDPIISRQPRSRANEDNEDNTKRFEGLVERLCPHVVICKDKNKYDFQCNIGPHRGIDDAQMSGFVRITNTTCRNWTVGSFQVEEKLAVLKCTDDHGEEVS